MNRILSTSLIAASAAALVVGSCVPAFADSTSPSTPSAGAGKNLAAIQAAAKTRTGERIAKLGAAIAKVNAAKGLTSSDRSTILGTLNGDVAGMNTVEAKIAADTTVASAAADFATIFTTYRVYAVALPQARIAAAADRMTETTIPRLSAAQSRLAAALAGKDASKSTPALQADLTDMQSKISAATDALDGVSASALAVTPADFNSNHSVLAAARSSVKTAVTDLKAATADGKTIRTAIK
ncbi:MAG TPA: hypothetical protein VHZ81_11040 [Galbitalea sp.]|jgi:hypothetical protein|nr:hypothetical protein [Galbitalea sp.]